MPEPENAATDENVDGYFACCEDCGKAIVGTSREAIRGLIALHKMEGCDD